DPSDRGHEGKPKIQTHLPPTRSGWKSRTPRHPLYSRASTNRRKRERAASCAISGSYPESRLLAQLRFEDQQDRIFAADRAGAGRSAPASLLSLLWNQPGSSLVGVATTPQSSRADTKSKRRSRRD